MIIKVSSKRGKSMPGLVRYLYGPGKSDEHRDQHMVAGYGALPHLYAGNLAPDTATDLGRMVESSWRQQYRESLALSGAGAAGISSSTLATGGGPGEDGKAHVYQLVVSLSPDEGTYTDEQWSKVAQDVVTGMGFADGPDDLHGNRWIAVRHGLSREGNDHIHIAVNLVRQDGRTVDPHGDFIKAQAIRRDLEQRYDFITPLKERGYDQGKNGQQLPAYTIDEAATAAKDTRQGQPVVPERVLLQRAVRAAAESSSTEADFLNAVVHNDVEIEAARYDANDATKVTGYKVRLTDSDDRRWYTASQLAGDLTLGKLRPRWADNETGASQEQARRLWAEETAPDAAPEIEDVAPALEEAAEHLSEWNNELRSLDVGDTQAWNEQMLRAAGVASAMSLPPVFPTEQQAEGSAEEAAGPVKIEYLFGRGADQLTQVAGPRTSGSAARPAGPSRAELAARQVVLAMRASSPDSHRGWLAVMQQFGRTMKAIEDAQRARQELATARRATADMYAAVGAATQRLEQLPAPQSIDHLLYDPDRSPKLSPAAQRAVEGIRHGTPTGHPDVSRRTDTGAFDSPSHKPDEQSPGVDQGKKGPKR